jgi:hypothetical protein
MPSFSFDDLQPNVIGGEVPIMDADGCFIMDADGYLIVEGVVQNA